MKTEVDENHIFLIQVHKESKLFHRVMERLKAPNHYFAVNIDCKSSEFTELMGITNNCENVILLIHDNIMHGGFSQIDCTVKQMKFALVYQVKFSYFHSISGQDYPCVTAKQFDEFFLNNDKSYMMMDTEYEVEQWRYSKYRERMVHWRFFDVFNRPWHKRFHVLGVIDRLTRQIPRKCSFLSEIWGGWNWFSLYRDAVEYLIQYFEIHPDYYRRFKYTDCGDELIYNTILNPVSDQFRIVRRNSLRFVEWKPKRPCTSTPLVLNEREYEDIINSGALFCRKIEWKESAKLMDMLDRNSEED